MALVPGVSSLKSIMLMKVMRRLGAQCSDLERSEFFEHLPYFIEYSAHFYPLKMMLKYSLGAILPSHLLVI
jgi:hypothetical protein